MCFVAAVHSEYPPYHVVPSWPVLGCLVIYLWYVFLLLEALWCPILHLIPAIWLSIQVPTDLLN